MSPKPSWMEGDATMVYQCPKCLSVAVKYSGDKYGPRMQHSIAVFESLPKKVCAACMGMGEIIIKKSKKKK